MGIDTADEARNPRSRTDFSIAPFSQTQFGSIYAKAKNPVVLQVQETAVPAGPNKNGLLPHNEPEAKKTRPGPTARVSRG
jgi:hypothetical protein